MRQALDLVWWDQMFVRNDVVAISDGTGSGVVGADVCRQWRGGNFRWTGSDVVRQDVCTQ